MAIRAVVADQRFATIRWPPEPWFWIGGRPAASSWKTVIGMPNSVI